MSYSAEKLILAKKRYLTAIDEAVNCLRILDILEHQGGQMTGLELVKKLTESQNIAKKMTAEELCIELEIPADKLFGLSDEMLDYGLWSSL